MTITLLLAALVAGLLLAPLSTHPDWWPTVPLALAAAGLVPGLRKLRPAFLLLALAAVAPLLYGQSFSPAMTSGDLRSLADGEFHILSGELVQHHQGADARSRLDLKNLHLHHEEQTIPQTGQLRLTVDQLVRRFLPGDRLQFRTRVKLPRMFGTPGEFNYPRYLASRGIHTTGYLGSGRDLAHRVDLSRSNGSRQLAHVRQQTGDWLQRQLPAEQALLLKALVLGDRQAFPRELRERVSRAGLAHLLAISGLHLGLLGWLLYIVGLTLYRRSTRLLLWQPPARILPLALIPFLGIYTLLTGSALATCRAFFMFSLAALLLLQGKRQRPLDLLQLVLLLLLLTNPLTLWDPGLQLSAAGVAGILLLVPHWQKMLPPGRRKLCRILEIPLATLAATLATFPLVALHFHQMIPAGLVSNLVAIPLIGFGALPIGLLGCLGHMLQLPGCDLLIRLAGWLAAQALDFGEAVASLDLLAPKPWFPDLWQITAALLALLAIQLLSRKRWKPAVPLLLVAILLLQGPPSGNGLTITALAVGQGESLLVAFPDGRNYLIDGGGLRSPTFDVGERLVAPALGRLGVHQLDGVILTHAHPDHYRGLGFILENMAVKRFVTGIPRELLPEEVGRALQDSTEIVQLLPGWRELDSATDTPLHIWVPEQAGNKTNDRSLAVYLGYGREGALLTGDLEADGVRKLVMDFPDWPVSLLKLPHHGSLYSAPEILLDRLQPGIALVSAGFENSYRLPNRLVVETCNDHQVKLLRTDLHGSISLISHGGKWKTESL